jgi:hypothetical protein
MRAEFSIVGSALNQNVKGRLSSAVPAGDVVDVVDVVEEVVVVDAVDPEVEQVRLGSPQPFVNGGLP